MAYTDSPFSSNNLSSPTGSGRGRGRSDRRESEGEQRSCSCVRSGHTSDVTIETLFSTSSALSSSSFPPTSPSSDGSDCVPASSSSFTPSSLSTSVSDSPRVSDSASPYNTGTSCRSRSQSTSTSASSRAAPSPDFYITMPIDLKPCLAPLFFGWLRISRHTYLAEGNDPRYTGLPLHIPPLPLQTSDPIQPSALPIPNSTAHSAYSPSFDFDLSSSPVTTALGDLQQHHHQIPRSQERHSATPPTPSSENSSVSGECPFPPTIPPLNLGGMSSSSSCSSSISSLSSFSLLPPTSGPPPSPPVLSTASSSFSHFYPTQSSSFPFSDSQAQFHPDHHLSSPLPSSSFNAFLFADQSLESMRKWAHDLEEVSKLADSAHARGSMYYYY